MQTCKTCGCKIECPICESVIDGLHAEIRGDYNADDARRFREVVRANADKIANLKNRTKASTERWAVVTGQGTSEQGHCEVTE